MQGLSIDFKQFFLVKNNLLTSVHNDADAADHTDDADNVSNYSRVIGIALMKAFSCAKKINKLSDYFIEGPIKEAGMAASAKITKEVCNYYNDAFFRNLVLQRHIFHAD